MCRWGHRTSGVVQGLKSLCPSFSFVHAIRHSQLGYGNQHMSIYLDLIRDLLPSLGCLLTLMTRHNKVTLGFDCNVVLSRVNVRKERGTPARLPKLQRSSEPLR